jgi:glycosyltransferase involved in cell wall biosynthesis
MRVLHLATTYPLHAGDSNAAFIQSIAEGLASRGHEIDVVVPWHPRLQLERPGAKVRLIAFRYSPTRRWYPWGYAQALTADRSLRGDAYLAAVPAAVTSWWALRRELGRRRYDILHAHWLLPNAPIAAAARRAGAPPLVISCHGSGVYLAERSGWGGRAARWALDRAAAATGCSGDLTRRLAAFGVGPEPRRMPYGADIERFAPLEPMARASERAAIAERHGLPVDDRWLLAVGRLVYKKGFDVLVRALPAVLERQPATRLLFVGSGPLGDELERIAAAAGVADRVHLLGARPHAELPGYYAAADLVVVPSVVDADGNVDGLPNTLMEGLSSGTPVLASRVAGIPDVVTDGENGVLVPPGDPEALALAAAGLLGDRQRAGAIGAASRAVAVARFGWDRVAERFEALYDEARR